MEKPQKARREGLEGRKWGNKGRKIRLQEQFGLQCEVGNVNDIASMTIFGEFQNTSHLMADIQQKAFTLEPRNPSNFHTDLYVKRLQQFLMR